MVRAGGLPVIVAAMSHHQGVAAIQENGCLCLARLALASENQPKLADAGAIEAVVGAMRLFVHAAAVQQFGCSALGTFAVCVGNQLRVALGGGITQACMISPPRRAERL